MAEFELFAQFTDNEGKRKPPRTRPNQYPQYESQVREAGIVAVAIDTQGGKQSYKYKYICRIGEGQKQHREVVTEQSAAAALINPRSGDPLIEYGESQYDDQYPAHGREPILMRIHNGGHQRNGKDGQRGKYGVGRGRAKPRDKARELGSAQCALYTYYTYRPERYRGQKAYDNPLYEECYGIHVNLFS